MITLTVTARRSRDDQGDACGALVWRPTMPATTSFSPTCWFFTINPQPTSLSLLCVHVACVACLRQYVSRILSISNNCYAACEIHTHVSKPSGSKHALTHMRIATLMNQPLGVEGGLWWVGHRKWSFRCNNVHKILAVVASLDLEYLHNQKAVAVKLYGKCLVTPAYKNKRTASNNDR
jgi:hypothetical protein